MGPPGRAYYCKLAGVLNTEFLNVQKSAHPSLVRAVLRYPGVDDPRMENDLESQKYSQPLARWPGRLLECVPHTPGYAAER